MVLMIVFCYYFCDECFFHCCMIFIVVIMIMTPLPSSLRSLRQCCHYPLLDTDTVIFLVITAIMATMTISTGSGITGSDRK